MLYGLVCIYNYTYHIAIGLIIIKFFISNYDDTCIYTGVYFFFGGGAKYYRGIYRIAGIFRGVIFS